MGRHCGHLCSRRCLCARLSLSSWDSENSWKQPTPALVGRRRRPELDALVLAATWCLKSELHHLL